MGTVREIYNGDKNRLNLPLRRLFDWSVRLILSGFCWSLYDGSLLAWLIDLWLVKELITNVIRFAQGRLVFIPSFAIAVGIIIWLLML